jgi:hypothetical protein
MSTTGWVHNKNETKTSRIDTIAYPGGVVGDLKLSSIRTL